MAKVSLTMGSAKTKSDLTLASKGHTDLTWENATMTWDEQKGTWGAPKVSLTLASKTSSDLTLPSK